MKLDQWDTGSHHFFCLFCRFSLTLIDTLDTLVVRTCFFSVYKRTKMFDLLLFSLLIVNSFDPVCVCLCVRERAGVKQAWWVWGRSEEGREGCTPGQRCGGVCVWDQHQSFRVWNTPVIYLLLHCEYDYAPRLFCITISRQKCLAE